MCIDRCIEFKPVVIAPDTLLKDAIAICVQKQIDYILVVQTKLVGIVTKGDMLRAISTENNPGNTTIDRVMTQPVITIAHHQCQNLQLVWSYLQQHGIGYLPIVNKDNDLVGVVEAQTLLPLLTFVPAANNQTINCHEDTPSDYWPRTAEELRQFFKVTPSMLCVAGFDGYFKRINPAFQETLGFRERELLAEPFINFVHPSDRQATLDEVEKLQAGQTTISFENRYRTQEGNYRWLLWTAKPDLEKKVIYAAAQDISERKETEQALQESEERWQLALRGANDGIWDWNQLEQQYRQTKLLADITYKIRMSIEIESILQATVTEVQNLLGCDRVLIVQINPNHTALVVSESILPNLPPMLGYELADPLLMGEYLARYRRGKVLTIDNLANASIASDIKQLLQQFQIQAQLIVPILSQNKLKSLLVAHQCARPRQWQQEEIQLLQQLADQIGVALSQAQLLDNLEELVSQRTAKLTATNNLLQTEIIERKQTEIALRENQKKLRGILENADEAIISLDEQQRIQLFNQGAEKIFGYQAQDVIGQPLDMLLPQEFRKIHRHHINQFAQSTEQSRGMAERKANVFGRRQNGQEFPAEASIAKLQTSEGMLFTVMVKDITERQQAQEKLQISQNLLKKAEKIAKIGSWEYNLTTQQLTWSDQLFEILGFSPSSIPNCEAILNHIHPDDLLLVRNTLQQGHTEGIAWQFNYRWVLEDGTVKYFESRGEPTVDEQGQVLKIWGTIMDINQRIQAEKSWQRSEEQLRLITDALPVLIAYVDNQQRYIYNNRTYETWFGKPRSSLQGRTMKEIVGESNYQKMRPYIETVLTGKAVTFENQSTAENGRSYWMSANYIPDFDADGQVIGFFSMTDDITDRKAIERMKSEFVSIASHEMRTPLTSIHGVIELLCAGRLGTLSASGQNMARLALKNSDRLVRLVNDILDLERMESGRDQISKQPCDSRELIQQAIDTLRAMAARHQISLETDSYSVQFWGDRDRLIQTLTNLISNGIKFSQPHSTVWITSRLQNNQVLFTVKDRGRGIPDDKQKNIFERFQQVDASDSRQKGGTGLGLAICRHIVEQHDGQIWVDSVYGEGSTFFVSLPQK